MTSETSQSKGFRGLLAKAFHIRTSPKRPKSSKSAAPSTNSVNQGHYEEFMPRSSPSAEMVHRPETMTDTQLGERRDNTAYLHSLVYLDDNEDLRKYYMTPQAASQAKDHIISRLPLAMWDLILDSLTPSDVASLAFSSKTLLRRFGWAPWDALNRLENHQYKIDFLIPMDRYLPNHLLCFLCASYHYRTQLGQETLKPASVLNPIYDCPKAFDLPFPRARITPRRTLPFSFVQLATRADRYGSAYGIPIDSLARRWKEDHWSHQSRYAIIKGHLFMRVISSSFASGGLVPSKQRLLLFSREDYSPYFSACDHWRDGLLMGLCKCALDHIPAPRDTGGLHAVSQKVNDRLHQRAYNPQALVTLCEQCRPIRRCPDCPSEYLIELKQMEDRETNSFKRAIMVTRWCDLGDGSSPQSPEWAACNGEGEAYDSIATIGKRAISGMFESHFTQEHIPGQRILSLNPNMERHGHDDPSWY